MNIDIDTKSKINGDLIKYFIEYNTNLNFTVKDLFNNLKKSINNNINDENILKDLNSIFDKYENINDDNVCLLTDEIFYYIFR